MKTFAINTIGCKVNQYESQQIRELLERLGLSQAETSKNEPDLVVINTCCVTQSASAKSRQRIRKAQKLSPDAAIVVCGCLPTVQTGELNNPGKNIHLISHRETVAATLSQIVNGKAAFLRSQNSQSDQNTIIKAENGSKIKLKNQVEPPKLTKLTSFKGHTRAFLKIQDGCDGYCSYCIVPKTRPFVHSKPIELVIQEAKALVEAGHKEIVVTGIFTGAYGQESVRRKNWANQQNDKLADLLDKMGEIPNLARIRISSLEPADVTSRLLDTFLNNRKIMPHLHLSLQSGSNAVLKRMCRQYSADEFKETIALIKSRLDRPAITTDIIVGFPGETEADFEQTVELAKETGFAKMHVFSFSKRAGTAAANLQDTIDNEVMKRRSKILLDLDAELGWKFREQFLGETAEILVENGEKGRSERYFMVYLEDSNKKPQKGELVKVRLINNSKNGCIGQVTEPRP
ncbi:MAG: tRNA (N(6)-L-threonylcarbamoyladenosine(37)-C(2))-methylthiotransferase MtaB [Phycisphaerae bacterium]|jgi:threonylcarbamoyladenosine tRNA methylthiotransferase MtaB